MTKELNVPELPDPLVIQTEIDRLRLQLAELRTLLPLARRQRFVRDTMPPSREGSAREDDSRE